MYCPRVTGVPPHLLPIHCCRHAVDDVTSTATMGDGRIKFVLKKTAPAVWGALLLTGVDKATLRARRTQSQAEAFQQQEVDREAATEKKRPAFSTHLGYFLGRGARLF